MRSNDKKRKTSQHDVPEAFRMPLLGSLDLHEVTIRDLQQYMSGGQLFSHDYVAYCLERIRLVRPPSYSTNLKSRRESSCISFFLLPEKPLPRSGHRS